MNSIYRVPIPVNPTDRRNDAVIVHQNSLSCVVAIYVSWIHRYTYACMYTHIWLYVYVYVCGFSSDFC